LQLRIRKYYRALMGEVKEEFIGYYATIFSRKAGVPICAALCILIIISYTLLCI
jgi:hypothetical protein